MTPEERNAIVAYRLEKCHKTVEDVRKSFDYGMYSICANRMYYAIFYACSALLIKNALQASTHAGVIVLINQHFVKEGKLSKETAKLVRKVFSIRQESDYDDFIDVEKEDLEPLLEPIKVAIKEIEELI